MPGVCIRDTRCALLNGLTLAVVHGVAVRVHGKQEQMDMASKVTVVAFASVVVFAASSLASAQGREPRDGACFFEDTNYRGQYFCVESGDSVDAMPSGANDRISSIRLFGRADVRIYRDTRFRGDSLRLTSSIRDLDDENFDDAISSVRLEGRSSGGNSRGGRSGSQNPELIVRRAYQDILERDPDPTGMRIYRSHIIDDGWTEQEVREDLRRSPEYRERNSMTRARAEDIVRQAYRAVLNREPDAGSRGYIDAVFRRKMTREDVERELRNSPEYRNQNR
jgi:hypothetical protein